VSGKRKTDKDRRALAPVPIVRLCVRQCQQNANGVWSEADLDLTYVFPSGSRSCAYTVRHIESASLVCEVALVPSGKKLPDSTATVVRTQGPVDGESSNLSDPSYHAFQGSTTDGDRPPMMSYQSNPGPSHREIMPRHIFPYDRGPTIPPPVTQRASWTANEHWDTRSAMKPPLWRPLERPEQSQYIGSDGMDPSKGKRRKSTRAEALGYEDDTGEERPGSVKKIRADVERDLFGTLHVSGAKVVAPTGELGLWFFFTVSYGPLPTRQS
jgi:hypothetical protein